MNHHVSYFKNDISGRLKLMKGTDGKRPGRPAELTELRQGPLADMPALSDGARSDLLPLPVHESPAGQMFAVTLSPGQRCAAGRLL